MGFSTSEELNHAISACKDRINTAHEDTEEKNKLVTKLVQLRLKLQETQVFFTILVFTILPEQWCGHITYNENINEDDNDDADVHADVADGECEWEWCGSKDSVMVRAITSHSCCPGSISGHGVTWRLSFPPSHHKNQLSKFQFNLEKADSKSHVVECSLVNSPFPFPLGWYWRWWWWWLCCYISHLSGFKNRE